VVRPLVGLGAVVGVVIVLGAAVGVAVVAGRVGVTTGETEVVAEATNEVPAMDPKYDSEPANVAVTL